MSAEGRDRRPPGRVKEVTSLSNPLIKEIRSLSLKKFRDREHAFIAEGEALVQKALESGWAIRTLLYGKAARDDPAVGKMAARTVAAGGTVLEVNNKILAAVTRRENPQMLLGVFEQRHFALADIEPEPGDVWVALDRVRDPGNLGTIIRSVDAVGAKGVILVGECADPYSLEAVRATMGSIISVPISRAGEDFLHWQERFPGLTIGTHLDGSVDYRTVDYTTGPVLLLMGNERQGLSDRLVQICDRCVRIPQAGHAESLNLAVATGIMLYEIRRATLPITPGISP